METSPLNRVSVSEQIFEQLKEQIIKGELKPGEKLPSENSLCKIYGVSRTTIRQALANLSSLRLIETRVGEGSFVMDADEAAVIAPIMTSAFLGDQSLLDLAELRVLVEPTIAAYACKKATPENIERLKEIYNRLKYSRGDITEFAKLDCEFHIQIAKSGGNIYLGKIATVISEILLSAFLDTIEMRGSEYKTEYHKAILETFINRQPQKTETIMREQMKKIFESIKNTHA